MRGEGRGLVVKFVGCAVKGVGCVLWVAGNQVWEIRCGK